MFVVEVDAAEVLKKWFSKLKPLIFIVVSLVFLYIFIFNVTATVQVAVITAVFSLYGIIMNHNKNREREINANHFSEKLKAYNVMVEYIFDLYKGVKIDDKRSGRKILDSSINVKKQMMVWGSSDVVKALNTLEGKSSDNRSTVELAVDLESLMLALRKDLGHNNSGISQGDLVAMIIAPDEKDFIEAIRSFKK